MLMMMHWGSALTTCSLDTEVQLCFRPAKMLVPPARLIKAVGIASPGPVNGAAWPLSCRRPSPA